MLRAVAQPSHAELTGAASPCPGVWGRLPRIFSSRAHRARDNFAAALVKSEGHINYQAVTIRRIERETWAYAQLHRRDDPGRAGGPGPNGGLPGPHTHAGQTTHHSTRPDCEIESTS